MTDSAPVKWISSGTGRTRVIRPSVELGTGADQAAPGSALGTPAERLDKCHDHCGVDRIPVTVRY